MATVSVLVLNLKLIKKAQMRRGSCGCCKEQDAIEY